MAACSAQVFLVESSDSSGEEEEDGEGEAEEVPSSSSANESDDEGNVGAAHIADAEAADEEVATDGERAKTSAFAGESTFRAKRKLSAVGNGTGERSRGSGGGSCGGESTSATVGRTQSNSGGSSVQGGSISGWHDVAGFNTRRPVRIIIKEVNRVLDRKHVDEDDVLQLKLVTSLHPLGGPDTRGFVFLPCVWALAYACNNAHPHTCSCCAL
jgi:hypothetical protein